MMSVSVDAQSGDLLSRVVSWWDTFGRKPNDPVEGVGVPLSAKCLFLFGCRSPLGKRRARRTHREISARLSVR